MALKNLKRRDITGLLIGIAIIILINIIATFVYHRFDLTAEKRFTLSPATKELLRNLDDVVYVQVYLEGDFPAGFTRLRNSTKEMLDEFRSVSKTNIEYEFIDPSADPDPKAREENYRQLTKQGLQYTNLEFQESGKKEEKIIFPGAIMRYRSQQVPMQLLKSQVGQHPEVMLNNSINQLEYELASAIRVLTVEEKKRIAFIEGHGELDSLSVGDISQELSQYYSVSRVQLEGKLEALVEQDPAKGTLRNKYEAIVIANPTEPFPDKDQFLVDQFIMRGGKVLWLVESVDVSMDSLQNSANTMAIPRDVKLGEQLFRYGARINNNLVMDLQSAPIPIVVGIIGNQPRQRFFPWLYFPLILPVQKHPIVNNLNAVKAEFISTVDTVGRPEIKKTVLLHSSKYSRAVTVPTRISLNTLREPPQPELYNKPHLPLAVLLEGKFESFFANRLPPEITTNKAIDFKKSSPETKMVVIADGDIIKNRVHARSGQIMPLGYDVYTREVYGNRDFLLNVINYLCDDRGLIDVRSREVRLRLLDKSRVDKEKAKWQVVNMAVPAFLIILFGLTQHFLRRRKYARS